MKHLLAPFFLAAILANGHAQTQNRVVIGSSIPQAAIDETESITTVDAFGNRTTTRVVTPQSAAQAIARQGVFGTNQGSRRSNNSTVYVPYPVPVPVYGQPIYGQPIYPQSIYNGPTYVLPPQNQIQQAPLGYSAYGWDRPPVITSVPLGYSHNHYPAPVYGQPVYGAPAYPNYCPPSYHNGPGWGYSQRSGTSLSIGGNGLSFNYYSSSRR